MKTGKRILAFLMTMLMVLSCWVWIEPNQIIANAANDQIKDKYLFAYFTGNSSDGQTIHLAVSEDGLHYTALRNNEPVIIPSKGTGAVRDPYIWYNEQDNYYYLICTDMDSVDNQWWDNCNGFLMWRSKDLVHWYDETFINVYDMLQKFDEPVGIVHRAWAPQILWDGQSYVVYFSIDTDNINYPADQLSIVYLKTNDLMDLSQYYEYGGIFYPGSDVNDADIIQHPTNGKWYLFYKPEATTEYPTTKINMMVSDNATGPYTSADPNNSRGLDVFSSINEGLEGGNGYFDNEGNFVMYADAYGRPSAYFYIAKTSATGDFKNWTVYGEEAHNINSLSPRHGSVVKITDEEYNRLLNNAYGITSSSFPATETLADHLVGRYFTTTDSKYNAANGQNDLTVVGNMPMNGDYEFDKIGYYAYFTGASYAKINMRSLFPNGIDYNDGFTITFTALLNGNAGSKIYSIASGSNTTNLAVDGSVTNNTKTHTTSTNLADGALHEFAVTYANGNIIVYKDGELFLKKNRFNDGVMTEDWFNALSNGTLYIGALGDNSGIAVGGLADFCIYDCALSYYDIKNIQNEQDIAAGLNGTGTVSGYTPPTNAVPSFKSDEGAISTSHYANILYSPKLDGTLPEEEGEDKANPDSNQNRNQAAVSSQNNNTNVGIYYAKETVMFVDGLNIPKMPVLLAARLNTNNYDDKMETAYPSASATNAADNPNFYLTQNWYGWTRYPNFTYAITNPDGSSQRVGHNSSTKLSADLDNANTQGNRSVYYYASVLALNTNNVTFNSSGYQKYNLSWLWDSQQTSGYNEAAPNNNIWVIDLRSYAAARNQIASEYDAIIKNTSYCPAAIANYKAVVEQIMKFNPNSYNYAGGVEAAVSACSTQAQKLVDDYNNVKAQLGACKKVTIPGREVSCVVNGLTEGSYCEICGEVYAEQQIIPARFYHIFGEKFQENGKFYVQCSDCGVKILVQEHEVRYENLFSFNDWHDSDSKNANNSGAITPDFKKDTISFTNGATSGESVSGASGNVTRNTNMYSIPVNPGQTYVLEYTLVSKDATSDIFIFYYDVKNNHVGTYGGVVSGTNGASKIYTYEFTPVAGAAYAELRFDSNDPGETVKFASIGVYEKENYDTYAKENPYARLGFDTGDNSALYTPKRIGYEFLGWYTNAGRKITNTNQLTSSVTVYAKWREIGNSVNYNGNLFSLTDFAKSNDYNMQSSVLDGHVYADFANGTFYTVSARDGLGKADLAVNSQIDTYNTPGSYKVPVTAGKEYVFTTTLANKTAYQCYLWFYNASGGAVTHPATNAQWINHSTNNSANGAVASWNDTTLVIRFTAPTSATHISFRLGTTGQYAFTQSFSNIGLYDSADYDGYVKNSNCPAMTYVPKGETVELVKPEISDWVFDGWYTGRNGTGTAFTSANTAGMTATKIVYSNWIARINVTFDNILDVYQWGTAANNGTISDIEENGFTLTSNNGAGEATSTSPLFPVTAGKKYLVDIDITGENWDVYIFFYDSTTSSGTGIDFKDDNTRRFSSEKGGNYDRHGSAIFTAPAGATRAVIRVDANGSNNAVRFEDIRVSEAADVFVPTTNKLVSQGSAYGTLPIPERDGYEFIGWFNGNTYVTEESIMNSEKTVNLTSKWVVSSVVADFDSPVEINPFESNESLFTINSVTANGDNGTFKTNNKTITYTPTKVFNGIDIATYTISFSGTTKTFDLLVLPASSVLYNEDKLTVSNTNGNAWVKDGTANNTKQTQSGKNDVYGYDANYKNDTGYSYGTAYKVSVDANTTRSQTLTFSYQGNAVDLYASCGENTGIYIITIRDGNNNIEKVYITDTYFSDSDFYGDEGKINQVPIIHHENSSFGTYKVEVTSAYLASVVSQRRTFSMRDNDEMNFYTADIAEEAKEAILMFAEMEELLGEDIEVTFCDENSVFNGGSGVPVKSDFGAFALSAQADNGKEVTSLDNYFDGFRVYNAADYDGMYLESEQGAAYYNVVENLLSEDDIITSDANLAGIAYIEKVADKDYNLDTYEQNGPKNELYLKSGASITLTVKSTNPDAKAMISLRTVNGKAATVAIANGAVNGSEIVKDTYTITNTTEMYYRINSAQFDENGDAFIITIQNTSDSAYLVIGTLRLCNGLSIIPMMMSAMPRVRMMMAAPATETEPNAPVEEEEILPSEPEVDVPEADIPDTDVSDTDNSDTDSGNSFINNIKDFINKLIEFINKIIGKLKAFIA